MKQLFPVLFAVLISVALTAGCSKTAPGRETTPQSTSQVATSAPTQSPTPLSAPSTTSEPVEPPAAKASPSPMATTSDAKAASLPADHKARLGTTCRSCHGSDGGPTLPEDHVVYDTTAFPLVCFNCHRGIAGE